MGEILHLEPSFKNRHYAQVGRSGDGETRVEKVVGGGKKSTCLKKYSNKYYIEEINLHQKII